MSAGCSSASAASRSWASLRSPTATRTGVARYLLERGYEIVPVYPREEEILGQKVYRRVQDVPGTVDLVDVFRRSEELPEAIDDALATRAGALWLQLGCIDETGARRARDAGLTVVMDRCLMVEHGRLLGRVVDPDLGS